MRDLQFVQEGRGGASYPRLPYDLLSHNVLLRCKATLRLRDRVLGSAMFRQVWHSPIMMMDSCDTIGFSGMSLCTLGQSLYNAPANTARRIER